ncbi:TonB-dependent receptor [Sphingomonas sp. NFR15]|uniref:TonB-dependent receptor domain-containing protein n=1 Tax=Sphingomonas sp. NFR15 TaxID=1566282 RepID=UPI0008882C06|nr:TonB-dependent receptor [Sphingomonas sp. NFR15]SDA35429.1 iron complex outermembrane recepter protein [Sphingomonas sp. NFR15]
MISRNTLLSMAAIVGALSPMSAVARTARFDIPAQSLSAALSMFARQSGLQVIAPADLATAVTSQPVNGTLDTRVALKTLIGGTGLEVASDKGGVIVLRAAVVGNAADMTADILVTAQRRPERARDVPISITAIGRQTIEKARINELRDLSRITPGLLISNFSIGSPVIAVRGATNTFSQIGVDKPVGIFVDDVYIPRNSASTFQLFGLESIQVLRGPQGTLFGKNVTGGALVFDTGRPSYGQSDMRMRITGASYRTAELDALADVGLGNDAAGRIAFSARRHDGWGRDRLTGQALDNLDSVNTRGQLRLRVSDRLEALIGGDYAADSAGGRTLSSIGAGSDGDPRTAESGTPQNFSRAVYGGSARLFLDTGMGQVTSVTAWRGSHSTDIYSNVAANYIFLTGTQSQALTDDRDHVSSFSQEIRLASPEWRRGRFVAGLYLASDVSSRRLNQTALAARTGALVTNQLWQGRALSQTAAVFVDGTLNLTPFLSVTGGARYTWDHKAADLAFSNLINSVGNFAETNATRNWSQFTPRASLQVKPLGSTMLYVIYSRGYTAGGFNTQAATKAAFDAAFEPETLENIEGGLKTALFGGRLTADLDGFVSKYRNKQELYFNNLTRVLNITNAGKATIHGIEAQVAVKPTRWATLTGTYGWLDTRYDRFVIPGGAVLTGNRLGSSPKDKASAMLDIDAPLGRVRLIGNAVYSYTSQYFTGATQEGTLSVPAYSLVNGSIGLATLDRRYSLTVFARNLLNRDYVLIPSNQVVLGRYLGEPRIIGASLSARF